MNFTTKALKPFHPHGGLRFFRFLEHNANRSLSIENSRPFGSMLTFFYLALTVCQYLFMPLGGVWQHGLISHFDRAAIVLTTALNVV